MIFKYVRNCHAPAYLLAGWVGGCNGAWHDHANLMRWTGEGDPVYPDQAVNSDSPGPPADAHPVTVRSPEWEPNYSLKAKELEWF